MSFSRKVLVVKQNKNVYSTHVKTHKLLQVIIKYYVCMYVCANKLLQICSQAVDKLCSHCLFPVVVTSLEQAVKQLVTSLMASSELLQGCSNKCDTVMIAYNNNVTRLTTQGRNNIVIS